MECTQAVRVLLVDDDHDGANSTAMLLRHFGAETHAVYDARLACDEARSFEPDLLLIDLSMPYLDGCAIARQLRGTKQFQATPLIVASGHADPADRDLCAAAGFDDYFVKPLRLEQIVELLVKARTAKALAVEARDHPSLS
jgi:CheY-like chemotaxis protein